MSDASCQNVKTRYATFNVCEGKNDGSLLYVVLFMQGPASIYWEGDGGGGVVRHP